MMRLAIEANASRYIEGFYALFACVTIGRRHFYVQRTRSSALGHKRAPREIKLYVGPIWGLTIGTWRTA